MKNKEGRHNLLSTHYATYLTLCVCTADRLAELDGGPIACQDGMAAEIMRLAALVVGELGAREVELKEREEKLVKCTQKQAAISPTLIHTTHSQT